MRANIGDHRERIRRRFHEEQSGVALDRATPRIVVVRPHVSHFDAELHQVAIDQRDGRAEHAVGTNDVIAGLEQRHASGKDCGHSRTGCDARSSALHRRQPFFETAHGGIGEARVDVALGALIEARRRFGRAAEHVAGRGEDRLGMLAFVRANLAGANRQRG